MTDYLDKIHFNDLNACDPGDVIARTGCRYDANTNQYEIDIWDHTYVIDIKHCDIRPEAAGGSIYHDYLYLFVLHYLMKVQNLAPSGTWVSEKDIVGGAAFFRGPHLLPVQLIVDTFNDDLSAFKNACNKLNGKSIEFADAAFWFQITPKIPVAVLYWQGDEDFPSEAKLLFDKSIEQHLPLDIIYALAVEVCHRLLLARPGIKLKPSKI
ncbi:MAG: DUF3786 domain-containing protein [Desulfobacula sp.]|nr:DUF3786 domain-containing protein [Desulfobacula sp.]